MLCGGRLRPNECDMPCSHATALMNGFDACVPQNWVACGKCLPQEMSMVGRFLEEICWEAALQELVLGYLGSRGRSLIMMELATFVLVFITYLWNTMPVTGHWLG